MENELTIPHDFECEQAVLGSIIYDNKLMDEIASILKPIDFHEEHHRHVYRSMLELYEERNPIDELMIGGKLKTINKLDDIGGYAYIAELVEATPDSGNIAYYAKLIKEHATLRGIITLSTDIGRKARDPQIGINDLLSEFDNRFAEITSSSIENTSRHIKQVLTDTFKELEYLSENKEEIIGLPTGFTNLDLMTCGLIPKDLILIGARPGAGKTVLAMNFVSNIYKNSNEKGASLVFTREMADTQLSKRILAERSRTNTRKLKTGNLDQSDFDRIAMATDELSGSPIYLNEKISHVDQIVFEARRMGRTLKDGVALVAVDYAQLLEGNKTGNREQEISYISRKLKSLALDLNIPVLELSQLNRAVENRSDKTPQLSDLRESGSLEQDADIILFIYREEMYDKETKRRGMADIIIAKHRNGPTGSVELEFQGKYARFLNLAR
jgi:replicative DNA helicase